MNRILTSDSYQNLAADLGTVRDKSTSGGYVELILDDAKLSAAYGSWLVRKIINTMAEDAVSKWREWDAESTEVSLIANEENRLQLVPKLKEALISARLFGGCAIYISTGEVDVAQPLFPERVRRGGIRHLTVIPRSKLSPEELSRDPESLYYGKPEHYRLNDGSDLPIHASRLVILQGATRAVGESGITGGVHPHATGGTLFDGQGYWGRSVLQTVYNTIRDTDATMAGIASMVLEANVDVLHIPKLMEVLQDKDGYQKVLRYLTVVGTTKSINGMMALDGGDPTKSEAQSGGVRYDRKGADFSNLDAIMDRFMIATAAAGGYPVSYLWNRSPSGLNSNGEGDMRNYARKLSTMQSMQLSPEMSVLDECLIWSALGSRPADVRYKWRAPFEQTELEKAEVGKATAEIVYRLAESNLFPVEVLSQAAGNAMISTGSMPGLESAIEEYGMDDLDDLEDDE